MTQFDRSNEPSRDTFLLRGTKKLVHCSPNDLLGVIVFAITGRAYAESTGRKGGRAAICRHFVRTV
jgi:hypothetical protein